MSKWAKIIVLACPDQREGADLEALGQAFHHQGPTFINAYAYCQAATNLVDRDRGGGVMICLGQGGKRKRKRVCL